MFHGLEGFPWCQHHSTLNSFFFCIYYISCKNWPVVISSWNLNYCRPFDLKTLVWTVNLGLWQLGKNIGRVAEHLILLLEVLHLSNAYSDLGSAVLSRDGAAYCASHFSLEISNIPFPPSLETTRLLIWVNTVTAVTQPLPLMVPVHCLFHIQDLQRTLFWPAT